MLKNYKSLLEADRDTSSGRERCGIVLIAELRERYGRLFAHADFRGHEEVFVNKSSGWVEAGKALTAVIAAVEAAGVRLVPANVAVLLLDEAGRCIGIRTAAGKTLLAENIILVAGAEIVALLARSAPANLNFYTGHRLSAAGLITGMLRLSPDEVAAYRRAPTFLHAGGLG